MVQHVNNGNGEGWFIRWEQFNEWCEWRIVGGQYWNGEIRGR